MSQVQRVLFEAILDSTGALVGFRQLRGEMDQTTAAAARTTTQGHGLSTAFGALTPRIAGVTSSFSGMALGVGAASVSLAGLAMVLKGTVTAAMEAERATLAFRGMLAGAGKDAGVTEQQVDELSRQLMRQTGIDDDLVKANAAVLLSFRSIRGEAFTRTMEVASALSLVLRRDLQSTLLALGKAAEDPAEGLSMLGRAGVKLTREEEDLVKAFGAANDAIGAQRALLEILWEKYGKVGDEAAKGLGTRVDYLGQAMSNLKEAIGGSYMETFEPAAGVNKLADAIQRTADVVNNQPNTFWERLAYLRGSMKGADSTGSFVTGAGLSQQLGYLELAIARMREASRITVTPQKGFTSPNFTAPGLSKADLKFLSDLTDQEKKATEEHRKLVDANKAGLSAFQAWNGELKKGTEWLEQTYFGLNETSRQLYMQIGTLEARTRAQEAASAALGDFRDKIMGLVGLDLSDVAILATIQWAQGEQVERDKIIQFVESILVSPNVSLWLAPGEKDKLLDQLKGIFPEGRWDLYTNVAAPDVDPGVYSTATWLEEHWTDLWRDLHVTDLTNLLTLHQTDSELTGMWDDLERNLYAWSDVDALVWTDAAAIKADWVDRSAMLKVTYPPPEHNTLSGALLALGGWKGESTAELKTDLSKISAQFGPTVQSAADWGATHTARLAADLSGVPDAFSETIQGVVSWQGRKDVALGATFGLTGYAGPADVLFHNVFDKWAGMRGMQLQGAVTSPDMDAWEAALNVITGPESVNRTMMLLIREDMANTVSLADLEKIVPGTTDVLIRLIEDPTLTWNQTAATFKAFLDAHPDLKKHAVDIEAKIEEAKLLLAEETMKNYWRNASASIDAAIWGSLGAGITAVLLGQDFKDGWANAWTTLAQTAGTLFSGVFKQLIVGGAGPLGAEFSGLLGDISGSLLKNFDLSSLKNMSTLQKGLMAGGMALWTVGAAKGNRGMGAAGGALAGGSLGATIGSVIPGVGTVIGAVVGALIGGIAGYFSSGGPDKERATFGASFGRGGPGGWVTEVTGMDPTREAQFARELNEKYRATAMGFRDVMALMDQPLGALPTIWLNVNKETRDVAGLMESFLKETLPKAIFAAYKPALQVGLQAIGATTGRITQELGRFDSTNFDQAMAKLQAWVGAIVAVNEGLKEIGKSREAVMAELGASERDRFMTDFGEAYERITEISGRLKDMLSEEQVSAAQQILDLTNQQYQATLDYLAQIQDAQRDISRSYEQTLTGFGETRARETGTSALMQFYQAQITSLMPKLAGATSYEDVTRIFGEITSWSEKLFDLAGSLEGADAAIGEQTRLTVEQYLAQAKAAADIVLKQLEDEAFQVRDQLRQQLELTKDALTALGTIGMSTASATSNLGESAAETASALDDASTSVEIFTERIRTATADITEAAAAARSFAAAVSELGGAVEITVAAEAGTYAYQSAGPQDLIRLINRGALPGPGVG